MRNAGMEKTQAGIKIAGRNINNLRYADDTTLMAEREEELKSLLMKVKEESEKVGLKLWTAIHHAPLSMELPRQDYWSGLPFPSPRELPYPRIKPISPALAGKFFTTEPLGKPFGPPTDQYLTIPPKGNYCLISNNVDSICQRLDFYIYGVIQCMLLCVWILSFKRDPPQRQKNTV